MSLYDELTAAAAGRPPAPDGSVRVLPQDGPAAAVVAFSAHFVVCADVDPAWVVGLPAAGRLLRPARCPVPRRAGRPDRVGHRRAGRRAGESRRTSAGDAGLDLEEIEARDHPRVVRALRYREDVRVWRTPDDGGHVLIGRGLAGRWEMAFEVEPSARGAGLGRRLARAAPALVPAGELTWAQVSPGHPASLRSVLAAGYRPVCAEVLLPPPQTHDPQGIGTTTCDQSLVDHRRTSPVSPCGGSGGPSAARASP